MCTVKGMMICRRGESSCRRFHLLIEINELWVRKKKLDCAVETYNEQVDRLRDRARGHCSLGESECRKEGVVMGCCNGGSREDVGCMV